MIIFVVFQSGQWTEQSCHVSHENINSGDLSQQLVDLVVASACVASTRDKSGKCGLEDKLLLFFALCLINATVTSCSLLHALRLL